MARKIAIKQKSSFKSSRKTITQKKNVHLKHHSTKLQGKTWRTKAKKPDFYESDSEAGKKRSQKNKTKKTGKSKKVIQEVNRPKKKCESFEPNTDAEEDEKTDSDSSDVEGNAGWADSIAKVLSTKKPEKKKNLVLSKAKKINKPAVSNNSYGFEVEGESTEAPVVAVKPERKKKRKTTDQIRVKPSPEDAEYEKSLKKVATQAVVQFFNAVQIQQKEIENELEKAGPLDSRRDAVYNKLDKRKFLELLKKDKTKKPESINHELTRSINDEFDGENEKSMSSNSKGWSVLRPDFMTNKKLKHWDKEDSDNCDESMDDDDDKEASE